MAIAVQRTVIIHTIQKEGFLGAIIAQLFIIAMNIPKKIPMTLDQIEGIKYEKRND